MLCVTRRKDELVFQRGCGDERIRQLQVVT